MLRVEGLSGVRLDAEVQGKKLPWFGVRTPKTVLSYAQLVCSVRSDAGLRMEGSSKNVKKRENNATHHAPSILAAVFGGHFARREQTRDGQASDPPARPRAGREDRRPNQERRRYSVARVRGVQGTRRFRRFDAVSNTEVRPRDPQLTHTPFLMKPSDQRGEGGGRGPGQAQGRGRRAHPHGYVKRPPRPSIAALFSRLPNPSISSQILTSVPLPHTSQALRLATLCSSRTTEVRPWTSGRTARARTRRRSCTATRRSWASSNRISGSSR